MSPMTMILATDWLWPFVLAAMALVALFTGTLVWSASGGAGDAPGARRRIWLLTITLPLAAMALYAALGNPRGLNPRDAADGPAHGDADGRSNFEEYLADTDPLDETRYFHLTDCAYNPDRPDRGIFVGFTSSSNRLYNLYSVAALSNGCVWAAMAGKTNYPGVGNYDGFNDTNAPFDGLARTYRVTVRPIPE